MGYCIKRLFFHLLLVLSTIVTQAQVDTSGTSSLQLQACLLATGPSTWEALRLSPDQLRRMQFVQDACKEECDLQSIQKLPDPISNADGATVMAEVRNILTVDQFKAWMARCTSNSQAPITPEKH